MSELVSRTTRGLFRYLMTGSTVGAIGAAFQDELFAPDPDSTYEDSSVRRTTTQEYLEAIDWTDINQVSRALRVFERLIQGFEPQYTSKLLNSLRRDGYTVIESTAKVVLKERGRPVDDKDDLPALVRSAQQALGLHPPSKAPGPDGSDAIKKILGSVSGIAIGLAELCNRGYGTGHGPATAPVGLGPRHAHLAVNAAFTWCRLMLATLADRRLPGARN
ncbi:abortive infection family protein [Actinoplanes sp. NPDC051343]|uniref:abortive infection family protein n=1 Tax=Actinoplanes sp. NPDC051343 TaxID=3363906 RepID=UPI0037B22AE6